ncbi:hypothetical protein G7054_g9826 [Neopestalotiopsis clavispora]|nr:hypothetical protein G7054_g9826 [Neopestalotiopsis clavispora]
MSTLHIVNIGSSFAAGPGIPPQVDPHACRSGENYAHIVAREVGGAKLTDLSVSGATLLNLLSEPQQVIGKTFAPQIGEIPGDANIVLVLGGGNDIRYIGVPKIRRRVLNAQELAERYGSALDAIHAKAPNAQVIVVEYLTLLGPDVKPGVDLPFDDADRIEHHRATGARVQEATAQAIQGREAWCTRIPVASESTAHGLGSPEPWVYGFGFKELYQKCGYHPNSEGMKAVAAMILKQMKDLGLV